MAQPYTVKVLEHCRVSPSPGLIPQTSLPLTFFDLTWVGFPPVQRLFFYEFHHPITHFTHITLPNIKHSLSLTLQHFYPLAGNFTWPPESSKPEIHYIDGDSVLLSVAESNGNFNHLLGYHARDVNEFYPYVPQLPPESNSLVPLLALQITVFPNSGICIGITFLHVIGDGRTSNHFMKSWASICRLGGDTSLEAESLPFYDRTVIKDPNGLETIYLNELLKLRASQEQCYNISINPTVPLDKVRATFVMGRHDVERLKRWVLTRFEKEKQIIPPFRLSTFVLTCAYVWVCLTKARGCEDASKEWEHFGFPVECRARLDPPIPITYFGNCLVTCFTMAKRIDLIGGDGIYVAAEVIGKAIERLNDGVLRGAENYYPEFYSVASERIVFVAGSPKLAVYETDFGWGRPKKSEVISTDATGAISLSEYRDGVGGLEVSLALTKLEMDAFAYLFVDSLKVLS